jgi:hypothetical protein
MYHSIKTCLCQGIVGLSSALYHSGDRERIKVGDMVRHQTSVSVLDSMPSDVAADFSA